MTSSKTQYNVALRGDAMLTSSRWNKGTAFTMAERKAFGLTGRLPYRVNTLDEQCQRAYDQLQARDSPLRKNSFLQSLKNQNWVLYFALLSRHLSELVPVIYTPTEVSVPDLRTSGLATSSRYAGTATIWSLFGHQYHPRNRQLLPSGSVKDAPNFLLSVNSGQQGNME